MAQIGFISYGSQSWGQVARFGVVGVVTFALNYSLVWVFYGLFNLHYKTAVTLAYIITVFTHFMLNRIFTYNSAGSAIVSHMTKYGMMLGINYLITISVSVATVELLRLTPYHGVVFATFATAFSSFFLMKYFVFYRKVD
jgi:putative flippase GtrA